MVVWLNKLHKVCTHHISIFTLKCALHICVYNTKLGNIFSYIVIYKL